MIYKGFIKYFYHLACNLPQRTWKHKICEKKGYELTLKGVESKMKDDDDDDDVLGLDLQARKKPPWILNTYEHVRV